MGNVIHFDSPGRGMTREQKLAMIYRHTHSDFKGRAEATELWPADKIGSPTILIYRNGTTIVLLDDLTDAEIADRLPYAIERQKALT